MQEAQQQTPLPLEPVHVPMSDSQNASATPTAPITVRGVACFVVQLALNMSMFSVTAFACVLWCVPGSLLLGIVASVEATINRTVGKRARTRVQQNPAAAHTTADTDYFVTAFGQVSCASQIYGLGSTCSLNYGNLVYYLSHRDGCKNALCTE